jgi:hypothetical protein
MENRKDALREAAQILGKAGGSVRSESKTKAVRENGKKGGRPQKRQYFFLSGEGEEGRWESRYCTLPEARRFAEELRAGGDRWCSIWGLYRSDRDPLILYNIDTDDLREVPLRAIMYL